MTTRDEAYAEMLKIIIHLRKYWFNCGPGTGPSKDSRYDTGEETYLEAVNRIIKMTEDCVNIGSSTQSSASEVPSVLLCPKCDGSQIGTTVAQPNPGGFTHYCYSCFEHFRYERYPQPREPKTPISDAIFDAANNLHYTAMAKEDFHVTALGLAEIFDDMAKRIRSNENQS